VFLFDRSRLETVRRCAFQYIFNNNGISQLILGLVL
jgi:hypothetical protein